MRAPLGIEQLVRTISWQGDWVIATLGFAAPRTKSDADGTVNDQATRSEIRDWADTVVGAVNASASGRRELGSTVVSRFGIDPERFGDIN